MGFRAPPALRASIVRWAEQQRDRPTLSEAVCRLVELGLTVKRKAARAEQLASTAMDERLPTDASPADRETRKRKLLSHRP